MVTCRPDIVRSPNGWHVCKIVVFGMHESLRPDRNLRPNPEPCASALNPKPQIP